ncbi:MAG: hypothetical protein AB1424_10530 [Thermodesulfobacteriota bacterium]
MPRKDKEWLILNIKNPGVEILWDDFVWVLTNHFGFKKINKPGSRRVFVKGTVVFNAHEPHGRKPIVHRMDRKRAIEAIEASQAEEAEG